MWQKNWAGPYPPPPHLDKIQKNSNFFSWNFPKGVWLQNVFYFIRRVYVIYTDLKSYTWKESFWRSKLLEASIFMLWSQVRLYAGMPFEGFSDSAWKGLQNIRYQAWNFEIIWDIYSLRGSSTYEMFCLKTSSTCKVWYMWRIQLEKISYKWNIHLEKVFDMPDLFIINILSM